MATLPGAPQRKQSAASLPSTAVTVTAHRLLRAALLVALLLVPSVAWGAERGVVLTWTDNSDNEAAFQIERKVDAGAFLLINTTGVDATTWRDVVTQPGVYTYRVRACNAAGCSTYTNEASISITTADFSPNAPSDLSVALELAGQALLKAAEAAAKLKGE